MTTLQKHLIEQCVDYNPLLYDILCVEYIKISRMSIPRKGFDKKQRGFWYSLKHAKPRNSTLIGSKTRRDYMANKVKRKILRKVYEENKHIRKEVDTPEQAYDRAMKGI
jgi:hypothetical protein